MIVAGGRGTRSGLGVAKQYARLCGEAVLRHSARAFATHPACAGLTVVIADGDDQRALADEALRGIDCTVVTGGVLRQDSVAAGLASLDDSAAIVLVHDAARPGIDVGTIDALLAVFANNETSGAVPVLAIADTLSNSDGVLGDVVDRTALVRVQTPQAFRTARLRDAHAAWTAGMATDDAQMVRAIGGTIMTVPGTRRLDKITLPGDIEAMERLMLAPCRIATGMGFDVHRLIPGDGVWLGGILIAHDRMLEGHSDADVALHAITDALLGAIAEGDIGTHFPPSDPQWRGAASWRFLDHARGMTAAKGGRIEHVDCTLICEAPKIGPHREAIRARIAQIMQLSLNKVSIKATTTERLGFTGRGEGIAAQAIVTVALPLGDDQ